MSKDPKVRKATEEDIPRLLELVKDFHYALHLKRYFLFEECEDGWRDFFLRCVQGKALLIRVSENTDGALVGFICCAISPLYFKHDYLMGFELALWVDKSARGQGHAKALIEEYVNWAKSRGCKTCTLGANIGSGWKPTKSLYTSLGFKLEEKSYYRSL